MDLDNNKYPDILVGAYGSNNAVYLKSAPVVHLDSEVQFLVPSKQVDLNTKNCQIRDGTPVPCVDIEVTLEYDGVGVPNQIGNSKIERARHGRPCEKKNKFEKTQFFNFFSPQNLDFFF